MQRTPRHAALAVLTLVWLSGCDRQWLDSHWRAERYVLLAIDARGQMSLAFDQEDGGGLGLVGPTVFSIGADDKHIVLKQHPGDAFGKFDRTITNCFVVKRTSSPSYEDRKKGVRGPMSQDEFEKLAASLPLPPFTKTFDDLK